MITPTHRLISILFVLTVAASGAIAQNSRLTAVISDTHFGVGKTPDGKWHAYEDARWASEFKLFLEELNSEGNGETDLVFNGDTFELWQSLEKDCVHADENLGCTEAEALRRIKTVIAAHRAELDAIRSFAVAGNNRVVILPGNHDAALGFANVAAEVLKAIGAPPERVKIPTDGYWLSADGLVYVEHGHQIGKDVNLFTRWPRPFVQKNGVTYLQRTWGEQFVQRFYNSFEVKYPIIDNIMGEVVGLKYGAAAEGTLGLIGALGNFARFYLLQSSWTQITQSLGEQKGVQWDTAGIRRRGDRFFAESIPNDDPLRALVEKSLRDRTLGIKLSDLTDEQIQSICEVRAAIVAEDNKNGKTPRVSLCPRPKLGSIVTGLTRSRDSIFRRHLEATLTNLRARGNAKPFSLFIFAHTHLPESSYSPFEGSSSSWRPFVVNSGAWQRTVSEEHLRNHVAANNLKEADVLKLQPDNLPACYPVIIVPPYSSTPQSLLKYWKQEGNAWSLADKCNE